MPTHTRSGRRLAVEALERRDTPSTLPAGFAETVVASGINAGTAMEVAPNGDVWVLEKAGGVKRFAPGSINADAVGAVLVDPNGERGLLGIAFDPNYAANKFVYLYHTVPAIGRQPAFNSVSRYTVNDANPADYSLAANSEVAILDLDPLSGAGNHNGGAIHFGPDGKLYVGVGDNNNRANAQSLSTRLGKILRVNADGTIPADNPTAFDGLGGTTTGANRAVFAVGLRNPYTFAFQPTTGRLFINDVGENSFEEIDDGRAGANYGWPQTEGTAPPGVSGVTYPVYAYAHGTGALQGFAVTGGAFYNPAVGRFPVQYTDDYFFADFVTDRIYVRDAATGAVSTFADGTSGTVDLKVTADGRLLHLDQGTGLVQAVAPTQSVVGRLTAVGTGPGAQATVVVANADGSSRFNLTPFGTFTGGVRVAVGDVTGDRVDDVVVAAGPGGAPHVKVYDGQTGLEVRSFFAYDAGLRGGSTVAVGDVDGDGFGDVVTGAGAGGAPHVKAFSGRTGGELRSFFAFDTAFRGGVNVAAGDVTGDTVADIVAAAGPGGGPHVKVFDGLTLSAARSFFAFDSTFTGGVSVATGDLNGDGRADVIAGTQTGGSRVRAFSGLDVAPLADFQAYDGFGGGVSVGYDSGIGAVRTGAGPGGGPHVKEFARTSQNAVVASGFPFDFTFRGGVFVS